MNLNNNSLYNLSTNPRTASVRTRRIIKRYGPIFEYKDVKKEHENLLFFVSISHGWNGLLHSDQILIEEYTGSLNRNSFSER